MKPEKPEIVFTFPAVLGGVSSFNFNIINHSQLIRNFNSKVVLLKEETDHRPLFSEHFKVDEQVVFEYSDKENQFHLQKRLNAFLGEREGAIVTDNGLTIEAARRFNNPKTVFNLIHDYYYVNQLVKLGSLVDAAVAHSSFFADAVFASNPGLFSGRSFYIPYGVKQPEDFPQKKQGNLNLVFIGRLENGKGVMRLYDMQQSLKKLGISVNWTIIGKGNLKQELLKQWKGEEVLFLEPETMKEVYEILESRDIFIFPTMFEGTPVSILEALSNGVIPIVHDLPGGIRDLVTEEVGFRCRINNNDEFVEAIRILNNDRQLLAKMQHSCFESAKKKYDIEKNADDYFKLFLQYRDLKRAMKDPPKKLKKLDAPYLGTRIPKLIRSIKK